MSSRSRSDARTGDLFVQVPVPIVLTPASMDFRRTVAQMISQMLKNTEHTRYAVAARMSELADHETSKAVLDSYTAESRDASNLPFWKAPVFELATNTRDLCEWHARVLGGRVLWGQEVIDADIGRRERLIQELQNEVKTLKKHQGRR